MVFSLIFSPAIVPGHFLSHLTLTYESLKLKEAPKLTRVIAVLSTLNRYLTYYFRHRLSQKHMIVLHFYSWICEKGQRWHNLIGIRQQFCNKKLITKELNCWKHSRWWMKVTSLRDRKKSSKALIQNLIDASGPSLDLFTITFPIYKVCFFPYILYFHGRIWLSTVLLKTERFVSTCFKFK